MELQKISLIENELRTKVGLVLIKPDAIELGIEEFLVDYLQTKLQNEAELNGGYFVSIKQEDLNGIYSAAKMYTSQAVVNYITSGTSILISFRGFGKTDIWARLNQLKGKKLINRNGEELDGPISWERGVRNAIPIPSTKKEYLPVFDKIKKYGEEATVHFTDFEFGTYVKNLLHTPDNLMEFYSLLKLLKPDEISNEITNQQLHKIKQSLQTM